MLDNFQAQEQPVPVDILSRLPERTVDKKLIGKLIAEGRVSSRTQTSAATRPPAQSVSKILFWMKKCGVYLANICFINNAWHNGFNRCVRANVFILL
jgi:hypothetical protein